MPNKYCFNQLKLIRAFAVQICKKRNFETSLVVNLQPEIKDNKLNITNINNIEVESRT